MRLLKRRWQNGKSQKMQAFVLLWTVLSALWASADPQALAIYSLSLFCLKSVHFTFRQWWDGKMLGRMSSIFPTQMFSLDLNPIVIIPLCLVQLWKGACRDSGAQNEINLNIFLPLLGFVAECSMPTNTLYNGWLYGFMLLFLSPVAFSPFFILLKRSAYGYDGSQKECS